MDVTSVVMWQKSANYSEQEAATIAGYMPSRAGKPGYRNKKKRKGEEIVRRPMGDDGPVRFSPSFTLVLPRRLLFCIKDGSSSALQKVDNFTHNTQSYIPAGGNQF
jgi:hypothetical protein